MIKRSKLLKVLSFAVLPTAILGITGCNDGGNKGNEISGDHWEIESPDGKLIVQVILDDSGTLYYNVMKDNVYTVNNSLLGYDFKEANLYQLLSLKGIEESTIDLTYKNKTGRHTSVEDNCNQTIFTFTDGTYDLVLTMRAYDDGYAFKYNVVDSSDHSAVKELNLNYEMSQYALPENTYVWSMPYSSNMSGDECFSYEETYSRRKSSKLAGRSLSMPLVYKVGNSDIYSLVTESSLIGSDFYGSFLKEREDDEGTGTLSFIHSPATIADASEEAKISTPFESPWRVSSVGSLKDITETEIVEKVYDDVEYWKPDDYEELSEEEKKIYDYDWVEPGACAWSWLIYNGRIDQTNFDLHDKYLNLASQMGWKYVLLDGGWNAGLNVTRMKSFCESAHEKGIKVIVWCNALTDFGEIRTSRDTLKSKLKLWKSYGADGIKIDFFDGQNATGNLHQGEDKGTIDWYEAIYQECAKLQMVVNCHGSNKPTGERRKYPNVINREAVRGNEFKSITSSITINSLFVRSNVGPSDFTPVVKPLSKGMTIGSQMALAFLYESGQTSFGDEPENYIGTEREELYKNFNTVWDDMYFVGGDLDEYYCAARKQGDTWYLACANGIEERTISKLKFDFLGEGEYSATIYEDGDTYTEIKKSTATVTKDSIRDFKLVKNGGFVVKLTKK